MRNLKLKNRRQAGFTIIEVIISIFIFSVLVVAIGGIFAQALKLERKTFAAQKIQENALRVFEIMAREIRISQVAPLDNGCYTSITMNSPFAVPEWDPVTFSLSSGGGIARQEGLASSAELVTSADVVFNTLNFCVRGSKPDDLEPARVTIIANIQAKIDNVYSVDVQTTITSRDVRDDFQN